MRLGMYSTDSLTSSMFLSEPADLLEAHVRRGLEFNHPHARVIDGADGLDDGKSVIYRHFHPGLDRVVEFGADPRDILLIVPLLPEIYLAVTEFIDDGSDKKRHAFELVVLSPQLIDLFLEQLVLHLQIQNFRLDLLDLEFIRSFA